MPHLNVHQLSNNEIWKIRYQRWRGRTDLLWLCTKILGYPDVSAEVHGPILKILQQFPMPDVKDWDKYDRLEGGNWVYTPVTELYSLPAGRRVLILDPRGGLKTTINAQSHTIQWSLNYPDIAMAVFQSTNGKAIAILREIKQHFQGNQKFRQLYPDYVPQSRIWDWGTQEEFTIPLRKKPRREHTIMSASIEKGLAGYHFDVMKFSDIVDEENSRTDSGIQLIIDKFGMAENLVVRHDSWMDVEGTRYNFSDLYGKIIEQEQAKPAELRKWKIHVRGAYLKDTKGDEASFGPDELDLPEKRDENNKPVSWWPSRWPVEALESYRLEHGDLLFACQKLNNPVAVSDASKIPFPVNDHYPKWIKRTDFVKNVRIAHFTTTVDTAETDNKRSDFSVITTCGWDQYGRAYVAEIRRGRYLPDELCAQLIACFLRWKPTSIKIEETGYVRGLKDTLLRYQQLKNVYLPLEFIKRDNSLAKKERILNTLQPWYKSGDLRFLDDLDDKQQLLRELSRFPLYAHDDILDTLADQFQGREWLGRLVPKPSFEQTQADAYVKWLGIEPFDEDTNSAPGSPFPAHYNRTGGL